MGFDAPANFAIFDHKKCIFYKLDAAANVTLGKIAKGYFAQRYKKSSAPKPISLELESQN